MTVGSSLSLSSSSLVFLVETRSTRESAFSRYDSWEFVFGECVFFFSAFVEATLLALLVLIFVFCKPTKDPSTFCLLSESLFASLFSLAASDCSSRFLSASSFAMAIASWRILWSAFSDSFCAFAMASLSFTARS